MSICMFVQLRKAIKCIYLPTYVQTNKEWMKEGDEGMDYEEQT